MEARLMLCIAVIALAGCSRDDDAQAVDGRVLWDESGCAFYMQPHVGDTMFIQRIREADKPECEAKDG